MPGGDIDWRTRDDQLRNDVITAANRLLETSHNHDSLSLGAIARELRVPTTAVTSCFPDKMSLGLAVYQRYFALLAERVQDSVAGVADPGDRLRAVVLAYLRFAAEYPDAYYVMFSLPGVVEPPAELPEEQRPGAVVMILVLGVVAECVEAGLMHRVDPYQGMLCLWSSLHGLITLRASRPHVAWPPVEELAETVLASLLCAR